MGARPTGEWRDSARHRILGHERPGWCYPTGRCAYLPSVTCYRQSTKPPPPPPLSLSLPLPLPLVHPGPPRGRQHPATGRMSSASRLGPVLYHSPRVRRPRMSSKLQHACQLKLLCQQTAASRVLCQPVRGRRRESAAIVYSTRPDACGTVRFRGIGTELIGTILIRAS